MPERVTLPISGHRAHRITIEAMPTIIFVDDQHELSALGLEGTFELRRGRQVLVTYPGPGSGDPKTLGPLSEVIGETVKSATAFEDGGLVVELTSALELRVLSGTGVELWHFHYPAPPWTGKARRPHLTIHAQATSLAIWGKP